MTRATFWVGIVCMSAAATAAAEPREVTIHPRVEVALATTFVARGVPQYASNTHIAKLHQVLVTLRDLGPGALTVGYYQQSALSGGEAVLSAPRLNPVVSYALPRLGSLRTSVGYFTHVWPVDRMHEVQLTATLDDLPVRPAIEIDLELVNQHGAYVNASLSRTISVGKWAVTPSAVVGVQGYEHSSSAAFALREVTAAVDVTWKIHGPIYVALRAGCSYTGIRHWWKEDSFAGRLTPSSTLAIGASD